MLGEARARAPFFPFLDEFLYEKNTGVRRNTKHAVPVNLVLRCVCRIPLKCAYYVRCYVERYKKHKHTHREKKNECENQKPRAIANVRTSWARVVFFTLSRGSVYLHPIVCASRLMRNFSKKRKNDVSLIFETVSSKNNHNSRWNTTFDCEPLSSAQ